MLLNKPMLAICIMTATLLQGCQSTQSLKPNPLESSKLKTQIAAEYIRTGDLNLAKQSLDEAIAQDPSNSQANMMMAVTYQIDGGAINLKKADSFYKRAISLDPKDPQIRNNYGQFLFTQGQYQEASEQFEIAGNTIEYFNRTFSLANLGQCYIKLNQFAKAEAAFTRALRLDKNTSSAIVGLADLYYQQGKTNLAYDVYRDYLNLTDEKTADANGLIVGIRILSKTGNRTEAQALAELLARKFPSSPEYSEYRSKYRF